MTDYVEALAAFETAGGSFSVENGHVNVTYPKDRQKVIMPVLSLLRAHRVDVERLVLQRSRFHSAQSHSLCMGRTKDSAEETTPMANLQRQLALEDAPAPRRVVERFGDDAECVPGIPASARCPALPTGVKLVRYDPKPPPVAVAPISIVTDVDAFIRAYLMDLGHRLQHPRTHACAPLPEILAKLAEVGVELAIERPDDLECERG